MLHGPKGRKPCSDDDDDDDNEVGINWHKREEIPLF